MRLTEQGKLGALGWDVFMAFTMPQQQSRLAVFFHVLPQLRKITNSLVDRHQTAQNNHLN